MTFPRINNKKICLIVNSNLPQSLTDAQWYAQQRGLDPNMILSFDFAEWNGVSQDYGGTYLAPFDPIQLRSVNSRSPLCTTPGYTQYTFAQACSQYFSDNACEGVICSTYTPNSVAPAITLAQYASNAYYWTQCQLAGANVNNWYVVKGRGFDSTVAQTADSTAAKWLNIVAYPLPISKAPSLYANQQGQPSNGYCLDVFPDKVTSTWKADNYPQIPHGRLGINLLSPTTGFSSALIPSEVMDTYVKTQSIMYRNVRDAIAAEQIDHRNDLHLFSTDKAYVSLSAQENARGYRYATWVGVNAKTINTTGGNYTRSQWDVGEVPPFFGFAIGSTDTYFARSAPFQQTIQGAYFLSWTSANATYIGQSTLQNGCCSIVGQFQEPFNVNCGPVPGDIFKMLYQTGASMMEANFICSDQQHIFGSTTQTITSPTQASFLVRCAGWGTALGDPLYSPYRSTNTAGAYVYPGVSQLVQFPDGTVEGI
jgi:hypothetical protein